MSLPSAPPSADAERRILDRVVARSCTARRTERFDRREAMDRLYGGRGVQGGFLLVEQVAPPSAETFFDVCRDASDLYVSVLLWESGRFGLAPERPVQTTGGGLNVVELLLVPWGDGIGFLQFGAGPGDQTWVSAHWPYRDGRADLAARARWRVSWHVEAMKEDIARFAFFRFPLAGVVGEGHDGPIGLNVMRTQMRCEESAAWSHVSGSGLPDATSTGWLVLASGSPVPTSEPPAPAGRSGRPFQLQATYDFPDEIRNGPYDPDAIRHEFRVLKDAGVGRIYWIDYPHLAKRLGPQSELHGVGAEGDCAHVAATMEAFGSDPLAPCARIAHEQGLEFFTVIKPYDLACRGTRPLTDGRFEDFPRALGGYVVTADPFIRAHPECSFRRNPAWSVPATGPVTEVVLWSDNDGPLAFDVGGVRLLASDDNVTYTPCDGASIRQEVLERPRTEWTPAGRRPTGPVERVRAIRIGGLRLDARYLAVQLPAAAAAAPSGAEACWPCDAGNPPFLLVEVRSGGRELPVTVAGMVRGDDFRGGGFEFGRNAAPARWSDCSEGIELRRALVPGGVLGLAVGRDEYLLGMLEPGFDQVRQYWLDEYVSRAIGAGADGVDVRIAHHHTCDEWLAYAWAEPVLRAFRERLGRDPRPERPDYEAARRIRGEFHTQFLRQAKALLAAAGRKLEHHVESRMTTPPQFDTYSQIHWDYATWIDEGILDGVNLKYLGPFNPFVQREILPRARKRGIPVHQIAAISDPRGHPRAPELHAEALRMARAGRLDGLDLYEVWVYLRTTPAGYPMLRGCTGEILERLGRLMGGG